MLFGPASVFGWLIRFKTWHRVSHVEVYMGNGLSAASRDVKGVARYPVRIDHIAMILRPTIPFNMESANKYVDSMTGTPYGWLDLLNFTGIHVNAPGIVCSPFATNLLRAAGIPVFNDEA